ncbi:MAG: UDP-N-acetylmuramoyl-tripeptide--D-alanyl-D-alanine ligase [Neisseriaceae bacterium]|nr:UDP-N-acetylmuramoyl-tripeptide--D-alanyl-D-alanine ligase [Neisseriaceae bacterium]
MSELTLSFVANVFKATLPCPDFVVNQITTDSRTVQKNDVFFALLGDNFDGHDFVDEVLSKGAVCVVSRADCAEKSGCLKVDDTLAALGKLAHAWRNKNPQVTVLAITGSSGKTTVKEMTAAILRRKFGNDAVLATLGNLNNHIGLPLTLLRLRHNHQYAVLEMGMNHFGELTYLTHIANPNIALINNALNAHIGNDFNGVADIAKAKSEIYAGLNKGIAIYPNNDTNKTIFQAACGENVQRTFGIQNGDIAADNIQLHPTECKFTLNIKGISVAVKLPAAGRHNVLNAAAAAALCADCVSPDDIAVGLKDYKPVGSRLRMISTDLGVRVIDDTYNANPDSMKAAIDVLAAFNAPRIFVMGDMGELGEQAADFHREIGKYAQEKGIEYALFTGELSQNAAEAFGENGKWFENKNALTEYLKSLIKPQTTVLIKGSRFMKMEEVVKTFE